MKVPAREEGIAREPEALAGLSDEAVAKVEAKLDEAVAKAKADLRREASKIGQDKADWWIQDKINRLLGKEY